ncbi:hypothetical protein ACFFKH_15295 [Micromonospora marina]|uniref:Uncharacterized protein n=1 Tax=Micromonospora marina TaxID=307120 RepID=A0A1C4VB55_9ACTN|nr:hypothetical protein [Micromonospora marina]SCE81207.1 hypothetical protein GA0070215_10349 [Micromonospora marina]
MMRAQPTVRQHGLRKPPVVALVICEPTARVFADPFFARLAAGTEEELSIPGFPMPILTATRDDLAGIESYLLTGGADGVLLVGASHQRPEARAVAASPVPVRGVGRPAGLDPAGRVHVVDQPLHLPVPRLPASSR